MQRLLRHFSTILFLSILCFYPSASWGQAISGDVTGSVTDQTGAAVPVAVVTATNESTGVKTNANVNAEGVYRLSNLPIGSYTITAVAKGFSTATTHGLNISLSSVVTANLTMEVGSTATTVEVTSAGAVIDTTTAQLQTTFETQQIQNLPGTSTGSAGSGIWNLSLIGAGVTSQGGVGQGVGPSISGQRPEDNSFTLDGVDNNNYYSTGPLVYVANDSVAEVSLLQNQFSPEFGGGSGGLFNAVVKTGGNTIHGSVYEYFQNRNLNAVDATAVASGYRSNPRFDNNRLGATIGGPIIKDKLFYFGNFEYNPIGKSALTGSPLIAPTAAGYSLLASIPGVSKTNLTQFQTYVPAAAASNGSPITVSGVSIPVGSISFNNPIYTNNFDAVVAIDYNMSQKDQIRGRWVYNNQSAIINAQVPAFSATQPNNNYLLSISEFHNFSPTVQNEFRGSFSRNVNSLPGASQTFPGLGGVFPVIQIDELNSINIGPVGPSGSIQNLAQFQDNMVAVLGKHTLKFGYHFTDIILTNYFIQRVTGNYEYNTFQQYLLDLTPDVLGERSAGPTSYPAGFLQNQAFFNDDVRILPNLTLNLGVRYEYVTEPIASRYQGASAVASVPGVISINTPHYSPNDWSPRLGFAYSPGNNGTWSIRGGFARAFDLTYANLTSNAAPPYFQQTNDVNLNSNAPNFLANGGLSGSIVPLPTTQAAALGVVGSYTFSNKRPYGITYNLGVQHVFHKDYTFEARYVGTRGVHLWNQTRLNRATQVTPTNYIPTFFTMPSAATLASLTKTLGAVKSYIVPGGTAADPTNTLAAYGSLANLTGYAPQGYSSYNGLQLQLNRRFTNNLSFIAAYTWSHLLDDSTATNFSTYLSPRRAQDFQNLKAEWASSALDHRHRFTFTPVYDFKPFKDSNWVMKNLIGNWNVSGTYTYETPEFATVQSGIDSNLNSDSAGDRSIINPAGNFNVGSGVTGYNASGQAVKAGSASIVAYVANNPNARFVVAGSGALSNSGRNNFPLKPTDNVDLALSKRFNFSERLQFSIGAQAFNIFNHPQFTGGYLSDVGTNGYTTARNDLVPSDPLFGNFTQFYSSNSRTMQLVAHFTF